jgi:DNA-binding XRE family transcriptional regulator
LNQALAKTARERFCLEQFRPGLCILARGHDIHWDRRAWLPSLRCRRESCCSQPSAPVVDRPMIVTACAYFAGKASPNYARQHRGRLQARRPKPTSSWRGVVDACDHARAACRCDIIGYEGSGRPGEVLVTSAQIRAARGLLDWTVRDLAERAGVPRNTLSNIETGAYAGAPETLAAIRRVLERAGVEFTNGDAPGVRLRPK